jgi:hypothetical protein
MYTRTYRKAEHERRFVIRYSDSVGWEVREEQDRVISRRVLHDWHRVERVRTSFAAEGARLKASGWDEL